MSSQITSNATYGSWDVLVDDLRRVLVSTYLNDASRLFLALASRSFHALLKPAFVQKFSLRRLRSAIEAGASESILEWLGEAGWTFIALTEDIRSSFMDQIIYRDLSHIARLFRILPTSFLASGEVTLFEAPRIPIPVLGEPASPQDRARTKKEQYGEDSNLKYLLGFKKLAIKLTADQVWHCLGAMGCSSDPDMKKLRAICPINLEKYMEGLAFGGHLDALKAELADVKNGVWDEALNSLVTEAAEVSSELLGQAVSGKSFALLDYLLGSGRYKTLSGNFFRSILEVESFDPVFEIAKKHHTLVNTIKFCEPIESATVFGVPEAIELYGVKLFSKNNPGGFYGTLKNGLVRCLASRPFATVEYLLERNLELQKNPGDFKKVPWYLLDNLHKCAHFYNTPQGRSELLRYFHLIAKTELRTEKVAFNSRLTSHVRYNLDVVELTIFLLDQDVTFLGGLITECFSEVKSNEMDLLVVLAKALVRFANRGQNRSKCCDGGYLYQAACRPSFSESQILLQILFKSQIPADQPIVILERALGNSWSEGQLQWLIDTLKGQFNLTLDKIDMDTIVLSSPMSLLPFLVSQGAKFTPRVYSYFPFSPSIVQTPLLIEQTVMTLNASGASISSHNLLETIQDYFKIYNRGGWYRPVPGSADEKMEPHSMKVVSNVLSIYWKAGARWPADSLSHIMGIENNIQYEPIFRFALDTLDLGPVEKAALTQKIGTLKEIFRLD